MAGGSESYHEPLEELSRDTRHMHQALVSLQEELEAVDWYRQRADACADPELRDILLHNMREEIEHACMVLEWLRRRNKDFAEHMETYLFTQESIVGIEEADTATQAPAAGSAREGEKTLTRQFTIGDLKRS
ncbi:ferritin [Alkalilimnicola ehrlichii]|uniref:Ferritin n=1 Tax=Alkalilimnicola ehrlichii TaxID=351052 RepID=A0A3E0WJG9_9GAMM|nr:encapsulin-associated ferritin-like protein [Alkalilimnicola ehrlichii]RFA25824.1 ferritin [Alkalilimnicola ehrlichii]RFA33122.1 ferritin [Alkalilimnicola ehrlichii]